MVDTLATASRGPHLTLRRVQRGQWLLERLYAAARPVTLRWLAAELGVSERTVARDVERLRLSGVPLTTTPGRGGGMALLRRSVRGPVDLDLREVAALLSSLAALGPSASDSAASAMRKLTAALV